MRPHWKVRFSQESTIVSGIAVISAIALGLLIPASVRLNQDTTALHKNPTQENKRLFDASLEHVKAIVGGIGTIATIVGGVVLYLNFRVAKQNTEITENKQITERFSKAVEQLGSDKIEVRLGGIYSLERIAKDSPADHWTIMEVLTAFIRERTTTTSAAQPERQTFVAAVLAEQHQPNPQIPAVSTDVQAALTVIGRRDITRETEDQHLNLKGTNLSRAHLRDANLQEADLRDANLQGAFLGNANLQGAFLGNANLQGADLRDANLQRVFLGNANLQGADLVNANLQGAFPHDANLQEADLGNANLQGAFLGNTNLQGAFLHDANLQGAFLHDANLQEAHLWDTNLQGAFLGNANLQGADLVNANLQGADLVNTNLQGADLQDAQLNDSIMLATDLRKTQNLTVTQLTGDNPPLLCNVALPTTITGINPHRDCDQMPQKLVEQLGEMSLEKATQVVNQAKQQQWAAEESPPPHP